MKLFLTGRPGVGKTTVVKRFVDLFPNEVVGFYTEEVRRDGRRLGFELVTTWGDRRLFAHVDIKGPRVSRYGVDLSALEEILVHVKALMGNKILVVDEIGKMELLSPEFVRWIQRVVEGKNLMVATIPVKTKHPLLDAIRKRYTVWEITLANRDAIPFRILDILKAAR